MQVCWSREQGESWELLHLAEIHPQPWPKCPPRCPASDLCFVEMCSCQTYQGWEGDMAGGHTTQCYLQELPHFGASFWQEKTAWRENQPPYFQIRQLRLRFEVLKIFLMQQKTQTEFFHELRRGNGEDITKFPQGESWQIEKYNLSKWCTWRTHRRNGSQQDVREDEGIVQFFKARGPYCPCSAAGEV